MKDSSAHPPSSSCCHMPIRTSPPTSSAWAPLVAATASATSWWRSWAACQSPSQVGCLPRAGVACATGVGPWWSSLRSLLWRTCRHGMRGGMARHGMAWPQGARQCCITPCMPTALATANNAANFPCRVVVVAVAPDGVHQPWEPELDWRRFSVPVAEADIPRLHKVLEAVTPQQLADMQAALQCAAQHLFYSSTLGSILGEDGR